MLTRLTAELAPGRAHGIVGRNGEGKTTLLRVVCGLHPPTSGSATWLDGPSAPSVAFLPAEPFFYPWTTAVEHLEVCRVRSSEFDSRAWCELLEVPPDQMAETFSSGMKRRLGLLTCIALDRPVFALDEPFNNLDAESSHLVSGVLRRLVTHGRTLLVTSHVPGSLESVCDEIHWLHDGRLQESFPAARFAEVSTRVFGELHDERLSRLDEWLGGQRPGDPDSDPTSNRKS